MNRLSSDILFLRIRQYIRDAGTLSANHSEYSFEWKLACYRAEYSLILDKETISGPGLRVLFNSQTNTLTFYKGDLRDLMAIYKEFQDIKYIKTHIGIKLKKELLK
jgi:hypothetical protein